MSTETTATEVPASQGGGALGLPQATALIMGSIIGTGVFGLPGVLAAFGSGVVALVAFICGTVGALLLAVVFGALSKRVKNSEGGPYAFARESFGEFAGFLNAWSYWLTAWMGNVAIVVVWVNYCEVFVNKSEAKWASILIALVGLWVPAVVNLAGVKNFAAFQVVTTILKFIPLLFFACIGILWLTSADFTSGSVPNGTSVLGAISAGASIALFSYLGLEAASVAAGKVKNPERNVSRATILGTLGCAVVYVLSLAAVFGTVPNGSLLSDPASFSTAANNIFGGTWAGNLVAAFAIISGIGALNGWTMICAEMPFAAAKDGLFPAFFGKTRNGVPHWGIIVSTCAATAVTVLGYIGLKNLLTVIISLSVLTAVIPYMFSMAAQLFYLTTRGRKVSAPHLARDITVTVLALAFCYWAMQASGYQTLYYGTFALLLGIPVYIYLKKARNEYGETPVIPPGEESILLAGIPSQRAVLDKPTQATT